MHICNDHEFCISSAMNKADMICQDRNLRFTELRRKVLEIIWANHTPVKAYDLLDKLKEIIASAKPSTVYRTIDFLLENRLIHKLNSLNAYIGCTHPLKCNECHFLICDDCGEVKECCNDNLAQVIMDTAGKNKFRPQNITLEILGKCHECNKKMPNG